MNTLLDLYYSVRVLNFLQLLLSEYLVLLATFVAIQFLGISGKY